VLDRTRPTLPIWILLLLLSSAATWGVERPAFTEEAAHAATRARGEAYSHLMRSLSQMRKGESSKAIQELHRAIERVPDSPDLLTEVAELMLQWTGRVDEAERMARRALEIDAEHLGATRFLAELAAARALGPDRDPDSRAEAIRLFETLAAGDAETEHGVLQTLVQLRIDAGDFDGAIHTVRRLVRERPGDLRATQTLAQLLLRAGRESEALEVVLDYATGHPDETSLLRWAEQLANGQDAWRAVAEYLSERAPFPRNAAALNRFHGEALLRTGGTGPAVDALELALEGRPHDLRIRKDLAVAYRDLGRLADAATLFGELAAESPEHPLLQQLLAETLAYQGDTEGALRGYEAGLRGLVGREEVSPSLERDEYEAVRAALEDLEISDGALALELRCRLAIATESWTDARKLAGKISDIDRERMGLVRMLEGTIAVGEKKWSKAAGKFDDAIERLGPYARGNVAEIYRVADRPDVGLEFLETWAAADPELSDARFHLGVFYYEIDRWDDAERELSAAVRLDPKHARALNFLGYSWVERDSRLEEALALIERALEVEAWNGAYLDSLGWVYHQMGRFEDALEPLEQAARELPTDATVLEHLGDVYDSLGQTARAADAWTRAIEAGAEQRETILLKIRQVGSAEQIAAEDTREEDVLPQR